MKLGFEALLVANESGWKEGFRKSAKRTYIPKTAEGSEWRPSTNL